MVSYFGTNIGSSKLHLLNVLYFLKFDRIIHKSVFDEIILPKVPFHNDLGIKFELEMYM